MTPLMLLLASLLVAGLGFLAGLLAWILTRFIPQSSDGRINVRQGGLLAKSVFFLAGGAGLVLGGALVGFMIAGVWWGIGTLVSKITPAGLALLSVLLGVAPMLVAALGGGLARLLGGQVDTSGAKDCFLLGFDLNNLVYVLFMSFWFTFFTGGIAVLGLIGSGIWALVN